MWIQIASILVFLLLTEQRILDTDWKEEFTPDGSRELHQQNIQSGVEHLSNKELYGLYSMLAHAKLSNPLIMEADYSGKSKEELEFLSKIPDSIKNIKENLVVEIIKAPKLEQRYSDVNNEEPSESGPKESNNIRSGYGNEYTDSCEGPSSIAKARDLQSVHTELPEKLYSKSYFINKIIESLYSPEERQLSEIVFGGNIINWKDLIYKIRESANIPLETGFVVHTDESQYFNGDVQTVFSDVKTKHSEDSKIEIDEDYLQEQSPNFHELKSEPEAEPEPEPEPEAEPEPELEHYAEHELKSDEVNSELGIQTGPHVRQRRSTSYGHQSSYHHSPSRHSSSDHHSPSRHSSSYQHSPSRHSSSYHRSPSRHSSSYHRSPSRHSSSYHRSPSRHSSSYHNSPSHHSSSYHHSPSQYQNSKYRSPSYHHSKYRSPSYHHGSNHRQYYSPSKYYYSQGRHPTQYSHQSSYIPSKYHR